MQLGLCALDQLCGAQADNLYTWETMEIHVFCSINARLKSTAVKLTRVIGRFRMLN